jgi:hypothetical protein
MGNRGWVLYPSVAALAASTFAAACSSGALSDPQDPVSDAGTLTPINDASHPPRDAGLRDSASGNTASTLLRVAHLSPDLGQVDFCYRAADHDTWVGPVLLEQAGDQEPPPDGDPEDDQDARPPSPPSAYGGVSFTHVTRYIATNVAGTLDVALVEAGSSSCAHALALGRITVDTGRRSTAVIMGSRGADAYAPGLLRIVALTDDASPYEGYARTRFVHAALAAVRRLDDAGGTNVDPHAQCVGAVQVELSVSDIDSTPTPLTCAVEPGYVASPCDAPSVDALGYAQAIPVETNASLQLLESGDAGVTGAWSTESVDLQLTSGSIHTGFTLVDPQGWVQVLWCDDASETAGGDTPCSLFPASPIL